ncbi:MAG: phosphatidate cytidylyltransferase [Sutterellaceae bacterium]|nr:phosphatidate cytidylyltransferase [Burkholderiaceae bacterium]MCX7901742.1 phosphatidate cytidylyltransferase [Burkholderiaceae bacterium]MDW8429648.1 phosphatidate cytidylyltransferase [Sutterellaceae bacterium]
MLRQRVITAVVLALALFAAITAGSAAFVTFIAVLFAAASFEWLRLTLGRGYWAPVLAAAFAIPLWVLELSGVALPLFMLQALAAAAGVYWLSTAVTLLRAERSGDLRLHGPLTACAGALVLAAAWFSLLALYREGVVYLLSVLAIVWIADIAAYFVGRAFGRRKLAPRISPGKTWAGVGGALAGVLLAAILAWQLASAAPLFSNMLFNRLAAWAMPLLAVLVLLGVVGDLFESQMKRHAGVKDSSGLLPGHGGVLDRIDALLPVLPAAVLIHRWA